MSTTSQTAEANTAPGSGASSGAPAGEGPTRLLLLDGHSLAFRAFYALPAENFSTASGQHTNAVYGFLSMVANLVTEEEPTHLAVAFDVSRATLHRTAEYPEYKSTRSAAPEEFKGQVELIQEALVALGVRTLSLEGHEADDIIATLATHSGGAETLICTGDRDALQLVSDEVTVLYPVKGVSELARFTPSAVEAKYGVTPAQYPDVAALRGDTSDNLPGVPKVGDKTAAKWITQYGTLSELIAHADEVKGKVGESFREHLPQVQLNRRITELTRDLDLGVEIRDLVRATPERADVNALFDRLEFGPQARDRFLSAFLPEGAPQPAAEVELEQAAVLHAGEVSDWLAAHAP
ncbi:DNA polymerase I, partial [Dietzia sp. SLG510A3-3B2-2]|nr:DNA polymerase I [Dietzia sp. SLG510A3-3B2-2]